MNKVFFQKFFGDIFSIAMMTGVGNAFLFCYSIVKNIRKILQQRVLQPADEIFANRTVKLKFLGKKFIFKNPTFGGIREIYCRKVYFLEDGFMLKKGDIVIDLGSNRGLFTTLAANLGCRVISVEAQHCFLESIKDNQQNNNVLENGSIEFGIIGQETGKLLPADKKYNVMPIKPPIVTMAGIIKKYKLSRIDYLKIDIEGSEFAVFEENTDWLDIARKVVMEVHLTYGKPEKIIEKLRDNGFHISLFDRDHERVEKITTIDGFIFAKK